MKVKELINELGKYNLEDTVCITALVKLKDIGNGQFSQNMGSEIGIYKNPVFGVVDLYVKEEK